MNKISDIDKQKIETVFNLFLDLNIGDVRKAAHLLPNTFEELNREKISKIYPTYDGGAIIGATILAMCVIHSIAQFSLEDGGGKQFKWFVKNYLKNVNRFPYDEEEIYALRCSLIKEYALIACFGEKNKPTKITKFALTDKMPHFMESEFGKLFNIKQFIIDIHLATQQFFIDILTNKLPYKYAKKVICYHDNKKIGPNAKLSN